MRPPAHSGRRRPESSEGHHPCRPRIRRRGTHLRPRIRRHGPRPRPRALHAGPARPLTRQPRPRPERPSPTSRPASLVLPSASSLCSLDSDVPLGRCPHFADLTRVTFTGGASGRSASSNFRLVDCQVNVSLSILVRMFVAVSRPPSGRTTVASTSHWFPSRDQDPSPNPPVLSNVQDRSSPLEGSLPIIWVPDLGFSGNSTEKRARMKAFSPSHS